MSTQLEMFEKNAFNEDFIEWISARLPKAQLLDVPTVAEAFDVSNGLVYAWCEEGHLKAFNKGSKARRRLMIWRRSVLEFAAKRMDS